MDARSLPLWDDKGRRVAWGWSCCGMGRTAGPSTSVGMTILSPGWSLFRLSCCEFNRIVIPTEVEGPAVSLAA
jgi:hypothetical protein